MLLCHNPVIHVNAPAGYEFRNAQLEEKEDPISVFRRAIPAPGDRLSETDQSSLVVCFGELLIDFVPTVNGVSLAEALAFKKASGVAPANVAVGIARLGGSSAFLGKRQPLLPPYEASFNAYQPPPPVPSQQPSSSSQTPPSAHWDFVVQQNNYIIQQNQHLMGYYEQMGQYGVRYTESLNTLFGRWDLNRDDPVIFLLPPLFPPFPYPPPQ
ncbi:hypothetical protein L484_025839 [Morus notabilis]|uniref:Carbohydrate kinase PfkB domain-containing protein n=1 Tax=Morus notabilis TaxID=981085 RepID=W9RR06_9ROSA|nr:hypothetical protein L484_025839 [Morus notabilis]